jgi:hypothetical protein
MKKPIDPMPPTVGERIQLVGKTLFGDRWRSRMAAELGASRSTQWRWVRNDEQPKRDIDMILVELIDREWSSGNARCAELADLRRRFVRHQQEVPING